MAKFQGNPRFSVGDFRGLFEHLRRHFEIEKWWPAESDFEVIIGAILTQNTTWTSVEKALAALRAAGVMAPEAVLRCPAEELSALIRPAGSFTRKTQSLRAVSEWTLARGEAARQDPTVALRRELLGIIGIGPETADDILLYVYGRPVFIFDAYARRMLQAAGWPVAKTYEGTRKLHLENVERCGLSAAEHGHFHGLIVTAGKAARSGGWEEILG